MKNYRVGVVEIRWADGDPDDVVAPWPKKHHGTPIQVHVERMDDGDIWMAIYDTTTGDDLHMWFHAAKKNVLEWTVRDHEDPARRAALTQGQHMTLLRRYHLHLLVIGAIRIVAGQEAANRYIDALTEDTP